MEKKEFFAEPGADAILKGKIRKVKTGNIATIVENLKKNEVYVIDHNIIPKRSPEGPPPGIPYTSKSDRSKLGQRFLKRGPLIELNGNRMTLEEAVRSRKTLLDLRREHFNEIEVGKFGIAGYGFWGIRDRRHRRFNLVSCIKGAKLFAYSQLNKKESELIKILEYDLIKEEDYLKTSAYIGADVIMEIPSETIGRKKYDVTLRSVPVTSVREKYSTIYDFDANHMCKLISTMVTKRSTTRGIFMDFHICAAYLALAEHEYRTSHNLVPLEMSPFAIPTQKTVDYYNKWAHNVVVIYKEDDQEVRRATDQAERELGLWKFVEKYGHDETFLPRKKLKDYRWH